MPAGLVVVLGFGAVVRGAGGRVVAGGFVVTFGLALGGGAADVGGAVDTAGEGGAVVRSGSAAGPTQRSVVTPELP